MDKLLVSWPSTFILEKFFPIISKCQYNNEICYTLEKEFVTTSNTQILHDINLLQMTRKENLSVDNYVLNMKSYVDVIALGGHVISDKEFINYILDGLEPKYDVVVASMVCRIDSRIKPLSLQNAQCLLQRHYFK